MTFEEKLDKIMTELVDGNSVTMYKVNGDGNGVVEREVVGIFLDKNGLWKHKHDLGWINVIEVVDVTKRQVK